MAHGEWCLRPGEGLKTNEYLRSKNGLFHAVVQSDSNFVVYRGDFWDAEKPSAMWAVWGPAADRASNDSYQGWVRESESRVGGGPSLGEACVIMQADGNFCLYKDVKLTVDSLQGRCVWDLWRLQNRKEKGDWAVLEDSGEFGVRRDGTGDWSFGSKKKDSIDNDSLELTQMIYDLEHAKVTPRGSTKAGAEVTAGPNNTKSEQIATLILAYTETTSTSFKTSTTLKMERNPRQTSVSRG
jgi:hypothetical protein